ncbi:MAG: 2-hydroxychromene-2-carboxylate isomerase [Deltaproteobacteria bacterium]|nr:2-hydroxychromene-2-carboxylate isomerase [Deltaproteobacteria bacterium]
MEHVLEFFFDYGSPFSYLADTQLAEIAKRTGAALVHRPMLLGAVLKAAGNTSPMAVAAKGAYMALELERWAKRYGVPFEPNPFAFRANTLRLMRGAVASQRIGVFDAYHGAVFRAVWGAPLDLGDEATFRDLMRRAAIDADELIEAIGEQETKDRLRRNTDEAVERGVFGAPAFFVGDEMFWGNDRLGWVEEALHRAAGR